MTSIEELQDAFRQCMPLFIALGDEVRLTILEALTGNKPLQKGGMNVNQITEKTHLSRPAVSHHLKILKEAGLVNARQEGTANYYYPTITETTRKLMHLGFLLEEYID